MVDRVAAAAGVLKRKGRKATRSVHLMFPMALILPRLCKSSLAFGKTYETVQAPPATHFLQERHSQIPTAVLLTEFLPQNVQTYRACWVISIFFTCLRREAPYLAVGIEH